MGVRSNFGVQPAAAPELVENLPGLASPKMCVMPVLYTENNVQNALYLPLVLRTGAAGPFCWVMSSVVCMRLNCFENFKVFIFGSTLLFSFAYRLGSGLRSRPDLANGNVRSMVDIFPHPSIHPVRLAVGLEVSRFCFAA